MRLTSFTDYGLRALMRLAASPDQLMTSEALADVLGVSKHHLVKVLQDLTAAGYVRSVRGGGGGVALARGATTIRIGDVVRYLERDQPLVECFRADGGACCIMPECRLRFMLAHAGTAFIDSLNDFTLADCILQYPPAMPIFIPVPPAIA
jgi:Rrf2 family nitric oxide-sensitive transcriptional repressor